MRCFSIIWMGCLLSGALSFAPALAGEGNRGQAPVAMVLASSGTATAKDRDGGETRALKVLERLKPGAIIRTGPSSQVLLVYFTGERYEVRERTEAELGSGDLKCLRGSVKPLPPLPALAVIAPIASSEKAGPQAAAVRVRSDKPPFNLYPDEEASVLADSARLSFQPRFPASKYKVEVENETGETVLSVETSVTSLVVSPGVLKPGRWYYWSVRSIETDRPSSRAETRFSTLGKKEADARLAIQKEAAKEKDPALLVLLAEIDRSLGLKREACDGLGALKAIQGENPQLLETWKLCGCPVE